LTAAMWSCAHVVHSSSHNYSQNYDFRNSYINFGG
jgi:hypothetical protein